MCNKRPIRANVFFVFLSVPIYYFFSSLLLLFLLLLLYITIIKYIYEMYLFFLFLKRFSLFVRISMHLIMFFILRIIICIVNDVYIDNHDNIIMNIVFFVFS